MAEQPAPDQKPLEIALTVTAGPHEGRDFRFTGHDTFLVGRSKHAHFRLAAKDRFFSRIHFMVEVNPPHCRLMDLKSRNGTYVNGKKVLNADLHDGDLIKAGRTILRVSVHAAEADHPRPVQSSLDSDPYPTFPFPVPVAPPVLMDTTPPTAAQLPVAPGLVSCPVCAAVLPTPAEAPAASQGNLSLELCPGCLEQVRNHPQLLGGYHLFRELGHGGMGVVYLAYHLAGQAVVALKKVTPAVAGTRNQVERFLREAEIMRKLQHPGIVSFRDLGEADGVFYFAMDYVRGTDLRRVLKSQGPLDIGRAVGLICQLLDALEFAHSQGFVHRDIKPSNLLVKTVDGKEVVMLADFGLARAYQASALSGLTMTGEVGGTTPFMPPEQISNFRQAQPPADQYAAGATLYNLLTAKYVFDFPRTFEARLLMILQQPPVAIQTRRPDIPRELALVVHRSLAKSPNKRFADVKEMREALLPFISSP